MPSRLGEGSCWGSLTSRKTITQVMSSTMPSSSRFQPFLRWHYQWGSSSLHNARALLTHLRLLLSSIHFAYFYRSYFCSIVVIRVSAPVRLIPRYLLATFSADQPPNLTYFFSLLLSFQKNGFVQHLLCPLSQIIDTDIFYRSLPTRPFQETHMGTQWQLQAHRQRRRQYRDDSECHG